VEDRANVSLGIAVKVGERSIQSMMSKAKMKETKGMPCPSRLGETCFGWMWYYNCGPDDLFATLRYNWG
jgi:hypothetical protein